MASGVRSACLTSLRNRPILQCCLRHIANANSENSNLRYYNSSWRFSHSSVVSKQLTRHQLLRYNYCTDERTKPRVDPFSLVQDEINVLSDDIRNHLITMPTALSDVAQHHFDGQGKLFRPLIVMLMARACNLHNSGIHSRALSDEQRRVAMISEMIHTASLVHDDVIDASDTRRGKASAHHLWGQRKAIVAGDFILSVSSCLLAQIRNNDVVHVLSQVLEDLVTGEFMQLGSKEDDTERFNHYIKKTFKKTASLIANSCKAVAILADSSDDVSDIAYQYGRNVGIAFQLVDDLLDFTSSESVMGKPTTADLKLGLATAPVLFAAQQFTELDALIMRRFTQEGDVERARELVAKSDGLNHTRYLAEEHAKESIRQIRSLSPSTERDALESLTHKVISRLK